MVFYLVPITFRPCLFKLTNFIVSLVSNGVHHGDEDEDGTDSKNENNNFSKEEASNLGKEARELEQRQYLQFQEKMLKKDAQMVELDQVCNVIDNTILA